MNAQALFDELAKLTPEERQELDVYYRSVGLTHNIVEAERVTRDTYSFFGKLIPCIILDDVTEDDEDADEEADQG